MDQLLLPYGQIRDFLPRPELDELLAYVLANPDKFKAATVTSGPDDLVKPHMRIALTSRDFGPLKQSLKRRFREALPAIMEMTGASGSPPDKLELELAAHGDGAFYLRHTDLLAGDTLKGRDPEPRRTVSGVFYFHAEPKRFSGGALRLFQLGPDPRFVDIEPIQNSLVVFHSWVPHEVRPVSVPGGSFPDYRFAINCWYLR